jgi:hypothetical protein
MTDYVSIVMTDNSGGIEYGSFISPAVPPIGSYITTKEARPNRYLVIGQEWELGRTRDALSTVRLVVEVRRAE